MELLVQSRCPECGEATFPRKRFCPRCGGSALVDEPVSDRGEVFSFTRIEEAGGERWIALVDLGAVRVLTPVADSAVPVAVGTAVRLEPTDTRVGYHAVRDRPLAAGVET
jgi:uncharacterized OB-fold protein